MNKLKKLIKNESYEWLNNLRPPDFNIDVPKLDREKMRINWENKFKNVNNPINKLFAKWSNKFINENGYTEDEFFQLFDKLYDESKSKLQKRGFFGAKINILNYLSLALKGEFDEKNMGESKKLKNKKMLKEDKKESPKKEDKIDKAAAKVANNVPVNRNVIPVPPPEVNTYKAMTDINKAIESCKKIVDEFMKVQLVLAPLVVFSNKEAQQEFNNKINEKLKSSYDSLQSLLKHLISTYSRKVLLNENSVGLQKAKKIMLENLYTQNQESFKPLVEKTNNDFDQLLSDLQSVVIHSKKMGYTNTSMQFDKLYKSMLRLKNSLYDHIDQNELKK